MPMTKQEVYDLVKRKLEEQGGPSLDVVDHIGTTECRYRSDGGRRCALGHLIPDELYEPDMEGGGLAVFTHESDKSRLLREVMEKVIGEELDTDWKSFLTDLQEAHDEAGDNGGKDWLPDWREAMERVAKNWGLTP